MIRSKKLAASLILASSTLLVFFLSTMAGPTFSGEASTDFTTQDSVKINDNLVDDVPLPNGAPSGWDVVAVYFDYDLATDEMHIGIDCQVLCGDANGDGDSGPGDGDLADLADSESFSLVLDTDSDGSYDVVAGVSDTTDISSIGVYNYTDGASTFDAANAYGTALTGHAFTLFANPDRFQPDLEFSIGSFSNLPGFSFTPGQSYQFHMYLYAGSLEDIVVPEEEIQRSLVSIPGTIAIGNLVWADLNGNGISDNGETGISGASVALYAAGAVPGSDAPIMSTTTSASGFYQFIDVLPGSYFVAIDAAGGVGGYTLSSAGGNQNPDTTGDHDQVYGDDGVPNGSGYVLSQVMTYSVGGQGVTTDLNDPAGYPDNSAYMTIDFGFTAAPSAVSLTTVSGSAGPIAPAAFIWSLLGLAAVSLSLLLFRRPKSAWAMVHRQ